MHWLWCIFFDTTEGINLKFVKRAADIGAKVLIADLALTPEGQDAVDNSENIVFQKTDVTKWKELQHIVEAAKEHFGKTPDVYLGGAGVLEPVPRPRLPKRSRSREIDL